MQPSTPTSSQKVFNQRYAVLKKISSGSFGVVFLGFDQLNKEDVAIKVEKEENEEVKSLEREVAVLTRLKDCDGIPKLLWFGEEQDYNIVVIQLLGKDLAYYMKSLKKFSLKTVLQIGDQLVLLLQRLHQCGVLHRDLKPENILFGKDSEIGKLYLVDFGISKIFRDGSNKHIPFKDDKPFIGTTRYASLAAHKGYELSRKDDMESMMYVLIFLLRGQLPWQNIQNMNDDERTIKVGEMKLRADLYELCKDLPLQFISILEYLRKLTFKAEPDYKYIQTKFLEAALANKIDFDGIYDWTDLQSKEQSLQKAVTLNEKQLLGVPDKPKPLERQVSGKQLNKSPSKFLLPPEPRNRNSFLQGSENKSISRSGSIQAGTHNSMQPKYQPSFAQSDGESNQVPQVSKEKNILHMKSMIEKNTNHHSEVLNKSISMLPQSKSGLTKPTPEPDTIPIKECDLDENYNDVSLQYKFNKLQEAQVQMFGLKSVGRRKK